MTSQKFEYHILLDNIPRLILENSPEKIWQPIKDVIRSNIADRPNDPAEVNLRPGPLGQVACCRIRNAKYAHEAYNNLQGFSWKGTRLRAWLLEKNPGDSKIYLSSGPIDPTTQQPIPVPVAFNIPPSRNMMMPDVKHMHSGSRPNTSHDTIRTQCGPHFIQCAYPATTSPSTMPFQPPVILPIRHNPRVTSHLAGIHSAPSQQAMPNSAYRTMRHLPQAMLQPALPIGTRSRAPSQTHMTRPGTAIDHQSGYRSEYLQPPMSPIHNVRHGSSHSSSSSVHSGSTASTSSTPPSSNPSPSSYSVIQQKRMACKSQVPILVSIDPKSSKSLIVKNLETRSGRKHLSICLEHDLRVSRKKFDILPFPKTTDDDVDSLLHLKVIFTSSKDLTSILGKLIKTNIGGRPITLLATKPGQSQSTKPHLIDPRPIEPHPVDSSRHESSDLDSDDDSDPCEAVPRAEISDTDSVSDAAVKRCKPSQPVKNRGPIIIDGSVRV